MLYLFGVCILFVIEGVLAMMFGWQTAAKVLPFAVPVLLLIEYSVAYFDTGKTWVRTHLWLPVWGNRIPDAEINSVIVTISDSVDIMESVFASRFAKDQGEARTKPKSPRLIIRTSTKRGNVVFIQELRASVEIEGRKLKEMSDQHGELSSVANQMIAVMEHIKLLTGESLMLSRANQPKQFDSTSTDTALSER